MPMPVSATASSIQSCPSATFRTRSATSPSLVNLQALLSRLSRICLSRIGSDISGPRFSWISTTRRFLFFSASCPVDQQGQIHRLGIELELAGVDLREVEHLVDEAEQVGTSG